MSVEETTLAPCGHCNERFDPDDLTTVFSISDYSTRVFALEDGYCPQCLHDRAHQCMHCDEYFVSSVTYSDTRGSYLCYRCRLDYYYFCEGCGVFVPQDDVVDADGDYYCEDCGRQRRLPMHIHEYGYWPTLRFYKFPGLFDYTPASKTLYMGVELEMECDDRNDTSEIIHKKSANDTYMWQCSDGSLDCGIEMISHPATLDVWQADTFGYEAMFPLLVNSGALSHNTDTCGLHIHLSRSYFTPAHLSRFAHFVNHQEAFLRLFSRRGFGHWCHAHKVKMKKLSRNELVSGGDFGRGAVNMTNEKTIEVRIYKGTLNYATFRACLEITHALVEFTRYHSVMNLVPDEKGTAAFVRYCDDRRKRYPYLAAKLVQFGHLPPNKTKLPEVAAVGAS